MAFYTIFASPGLPDSDHRRALRLGPPAVATPSNYRSLLRTAGFVEFYELDVTDAYLFTARNWLRHQRRLAAKLRILEPSGAFDDRLAQRASTVAAIEDGLLRRSLFVATRGRC